MLCGGTLDLAMESCSKGKVVKDRRLDKIAPR